LQETITEFPYYETITGNGQQLNVVVDNVTDGWVVGSLTCQYKLEYFVGNERPQLRLLLGPYYKGRAIGLCQNYNDDPTDEDKDCAKPPNGADMTTILANCSCPTNDKACNKKLNTV
jgi:hypothetical protein